MNNTADYAQCIIKVVKKSKNKYGPKAQVGDVLCITRSFVNSWGTHKLNCIDQNGKEFMVTIKSIKFLDENDSECINFNVNAALKSWVESTHIPVIFKPIAMSRNKQSVKCDVINSKNFNDQWMSLKFVRNSDGGEFDKVILKKFQSAYIPTWFAKKIGLISKDKDN